MEILNAEITRTSLGIEGHGILTFWLHLRYGSAGQGFGGYSLEGRGKYVSMKIIHRILEVVGVEEWEDLPGQHVRVEKTSHFGSIIRIGNLLKDDWLNLETFFSEEE